MRHVIQIVLASVTMAGAAQAQEERIIDNFAGLGVRAMGMGGRLHRSR